MVDLTLPAVDAGGTVRPRAFRQEDDGTGGKKYTAIGVEHPEQRAELINRQEQIRDAVALLTIGVTFVDRSVTLTADHIAGKAAILAQRNRQVLQFGAARDFSIALTAEQASGMRVYASARDDFEGKRCPANALYLATGSGFAAGDIITIWEA